MLGILRTLLGIVTGSPEKSIFPPYANRNERQSCVCGRLRHDIHNNIWKVTEKEDDPILPKYYYRCPHCRSFSAVNIYFPMEKYERVPLEYININEQKAALNRARVSFLKETFGRLLPHRPIVYDLGAGEGCFVHSFSDEYPEGEVFAVEADSRLSSKFYNGQNPRIQFVNLFIEDFLSAQLNSQEKSAPNLIVLTDVLEHLINPEKMLTQINGVLGTHGLAYIVVPNSLTFHDDPYPVPPEEVDWDHANRTCQHIWMLDPIQVRRLVSNSLTILEENDSFETNLRRDSVYTMIVAQKS